MNAPRQRRGSIFTSLLVLLLMGISFLLGGYFPATQGDSESSEHSHPTETPRSSKTWTCSMHPQIKLPAPGLCPICSMDLIPLEEGAEASDPSLHRMTPAAHSLARIETTPVTRQNVTRTIRLVGKVAYDETRVEEITARFPGRLDKLFVDFTGITVRHGDHLARIYSPELLTAQQELLQALKAKRSLRGPKDGFLYQTTLTTVEAAREKLRLWGMTPKQIQEIERSGQPSDHLVLFAHQAGIVVRKHAVQGAYVKEGTRIYTIADLTQVWVNLDAYESDIAWIRENQAVHFEAEAYPGETFQGRITFIHPILDERSRTIKLRVNVPNPDGRLRPGMFLRARVLARAGLDGAQPELPPEGMWVCPMHPRVVSDKPGTCSSCGMPLEEVRNDERVASNVGEPPLPLVIPRSAALRTGKRSLVYVEVPDQEEPTYQARVITLGPRAGDYYLVREGLQEGERVVTRGNFKIDSAVQLLAGPSMMSIPSEGVEEAPSLSGTSFGDASRDLGSLVQVVGLALREQDGDAGSEAFEALSEAVQNLPLEGLGPDQEARARELRGELLLAAQAGAEAWELPEQLEAFQLLLDHLLGLHPASPLAKATLSSIRGLQAQARQVAAHLAGDDPIGAVKVLSSQEVLAALLPNEDNGNPGGGDLFLRWKLGLLLQDLRSKEDLDGLRKALAPLADELVGLASSHPGLASGGRLLTCPMAFDGKGARWLQEEGPIANPYFGATMLRCGEEVDLVRWGR